MTREQTFTGLRGGPQDPVGTGECAMQSLRGGFIIERAEGERKGFASPEMVSLKIPICFSKLQGMR